jgi:hypothetical protein
MEEDHTEYMESGGLYPICEGRHEGSLNVDERIHTNGSKIIQHEATDDEKLDEPIDKNIDTETQPNSTIINIL